MPCGRSRTTTTSRSDRATRRRTPTPYRPAVGAAAVMAKQPTVLHLFSGSGGGGLGFRRAGFRGVGAVDYSAAACRDFEMLVGERATHADLLDLEPGDLARICPESPDVVFTSPPCKGFSGCLPERRSRDDHYLRLNSLAFRGVFLALEAWKRPPKLLLLENVPRIQTRGKSWLSQVKAMLHAYGYAVHESVHDCGVLGGLAQRRRRFLLVARHIEQVPSILRVPADQRVKTIGEVLERLRVPRPGSKQGGPMHGLPRLSALNWIRLATIPAGKDWRSIPAAVKLPPRPGRPNGPFGVEDWEASSHAVLGHTSARDTWGSVADPRVVCKRRDGGHGVRPWDGQSAAVIGHATIDNFPAQVADPRAVETTHRIVTHDDAPGLLGPHVDLSKRTPMHLIIASADGSWHRPMTTLELAALQDFPTEVDGKPLVLDGGNSKGWRERVGNAVPPGTARAIALSCAATLAAADAGRGELSTNPIWVREQARRMEAAS